MIDKKFDITKLEKLNHPGRIVDIDPTFIWNKIGLPNAAIIADIGAGTGIFSKEFSKLWPKSKILALDISPIMISWMNENICPYFPSISTMLMKESETPLDDNSVDVVIMINLHHELHDEVAMIKECRRVLKKGGKIAISDWKKQETPKGPPLDIRFDSSEVAEQLANCNFEKIKTFNSQINNWLVVGTKTVDSETV